MKVKITKIIMGGSLLVFLAAVSIGSLFAPDREFSDNENRYLATMPELSWDTVLDCSFQDGLEKYLNDQIFGRDGWITIKTGIQKLVGDTDIGGAYVGKDGYDFEKITEDDVNEGLFERNIVQVQKFFENCKKDIAPDRLSFMLVPTSGLILADKLPANAPLFDQSSYIDRVETAMQGYNYIDVREVLLAHKDEDIYYRTDHHWTGTGAFYGYAQWCNSVGEAFAASDYVTETVTEEFRGSLYSKILDYDSAYDSIKIYKKDGAQTSFVVTLDGKEQGQFYHYDKLQEKDKYLFFLGGNYGEVHAERQGVEKEGKNLLLIKDSFANTMLPLLAEHYDNVYMIDLRYYRGDMTEYMQENEITDVLLLYNISNFIADKNMHKLN